MSLRSPINQFCGVDGRPHPPEITFCQKCGSGRILPRLEVDVGQLNDGSEAKPIPIDGGPTPARRARPAQDHLNGANAKQQKREKKQAAVESSVHAGSTALSMRSVIDNPKQRQTLDFFTITVTLWRGTWKWVNADLNIKKPHEKEIFIESLRIRVRDQAVSSLSEFMQQIILPRLTDSGQTAFADSLNNLTIATGPPLREKPKNSSIVVGQDEIQTVKGLLSHHLDHDKLTNSYQLHLTLSTESQSGDESDSQARSPPRIHKQPKLMNIGPIKHETKSRKGKKRETVTRQSSAELTLTSTRKSPSIKDEDVVIKEERLSFTSRSSSESLSEVDLPEIKDILASAARRSGTREMTREKTADVEDSVEDNSAHNTRFKNKRRGPTK